MRVTARQVSYLPVLSNQTAQKAIAFSQSVENILMELEDFIQFTRLTRKFRHVLNVTWVILNVFHKLDQDSSGEGTDATREINQGYRDLRRHYGDARCRAQGGPMYMD